MIKIVSTSEVLDSETEIILSIISKSVYQSNGKSVMFQFTDYIGSEICNKKVYYRPRSGMFAKRTCDYIVNVNIIDKVLVLNKTPRFKKCIYCNKKKCDVKLSCCEKKCHYNCAIYNNFMCDCEEKSLTCKKISLIDNAPSSEDDTKCVVCMDDCETVTKCGHRICRSCLDTIYCEHGNNLKCPMCRRGLIEKKENNSVEMKINVDGVDVVTNFIIES